MDEAPAFALSDVEVSYAGHRALESLDLGIRRGEVLAFVGPSGAGKSTALGLLNGIVYPTGGRVVVHGHDMSTLEPDALRRLRTRIGTIPQDLGLVPNLRVAQNVLAGRAGKQSGFASLRSLVWPPREDMEAVLRILERLGIGDKLYQRTDSLSGGERQRVAIARALYQGADTLLADEPFSALDPSRANETLQLFVEVAQERGMTLILSTHMVELARRYVPRLIGLRRGRRLFDVETVALSDAQLEELYRLEEEHKDDRRQGGEHA